MVRADQPTLQALRDEGCRFAVTKEGAQDSKEQGAKAPMGKAWQHGDLDAVGGMDKFYSERRWIHVILEPGNMLVVDIDDMHSAKGQEICQLLAEKDCPRASTRKGVHFYFKRNETSDGILNGRKAAKLRSSSRKNAKHIGDFIASNVIAYKLENEAVFRTLDDYEGLLPLLGLETKSERLPIDKEFDVKNHFLRKVQALEQGERDDGMRDILWALAHRLQQHGLSVEWEGAPSDLVKVYDTEVNPSEKGKWNKERWIEILGKVGKVEQLKHDKDIDEDVANAAARSYIADHQGHVIVSASGSNEDREIYEWMPSTENWSIRRAGYRFNGRPSLFETLAERYREIMTEASGSAPTLSKTNKAVEAIFTKVKRERAVESPAVLFDTNSGRRTMFLCEKEGQQYVCKVDLGKKGAAAYEFEKGNKAEYMLTHSIGEVSKMVGDEKAIRNTTWHKALTEVLVDEEIVDYFGSLVAMAMVDSEEEQFVICVGGGANGKSMVLEAIDEAMDDFSTSVSEEAFAMGVDQKRQLDERTPMVGKRAVFCTEGGDIPLDMNFIKRITSGEMALVGGMFKVSRRVSIKTTPFIAANELPRIRSVSNAVGRRMKVVPFPRAFNDPDCPIPMDKDLKPKLKGELNHEVKAWILHSIRKYIIGDREIVIPQAVLEQTHDHMETQKLPVEEAFQRFFVASGEKFLMRMGEPSEKGKNEYGRGLMGVKEMFEKEAGMTKKMNRAGLRRILAKMGIRPSDQSTYNAMPTDEFIGWLKDKFSPTEAEQIWEGLWAPEKRMTGGKRPPNPDFHSLEVEGLVKARNEEDDDEVELGI